MTTSQSNELVTIHCRPQLIRFKLSGEDLLHFERKEKKKVFDFFSLCKYISSTGRNYHITFKQYSNGTVE